MVSRQCHQMVLTTRRLPHRHLCNQLWMQIVVMPLIAHLPRRHLCNQLLQLLHLSHRQLRMVFRKCHQMVPTCLPQRQLCNQLWMQIVVMPLITHLPPRHLCNQLLQLLHLSHRQLRIVFRKCHQTVPTCLPHRQLCNQLWIRIAVTPLVTCLPCWQLCNQLLQRLRLYHQQPQ